MLARLLNHLQVVVEDILKQQVCQYAPMWNHHDNDGPDQRIQQILLFSELIHIMQIYAFFRSAGADSLKKKARSLN